MALRCHGKASEIGQNRFLQNSTAKILPGQTIESKWGGWGGGAAWRNLTFYRGSPTKGSLLIFESISQSEASKATLI